MIREDNILSNISYFSEWGGAGWNRLVEHALRDYLGKDLSGKHVLEIGSRYGKMSSLFALMGATVEGVDVAEHTIPIAIAEAKKWNVSDKTHFTIYDGNLDIFEDEKFDIVFTKSVLVLIPDLARTLDVVKSKLKTGGRVVFIENAKGNVMLHPLRRLRHRTWDYRNANYFTQTHIDTIATHFRMLCIKKTIWPPVYLLIGEK